MPIILLRLLYFGALLQITAYYAQIMLHNQYFLYLVLLQAIYHTMGFICKVLICVNHVRCHELTD